MLNTAYDRPRTVPMVSDRPTTKTAVPNSAAMFGDTTDIDVEEALRMMASGMDDTIAGMPLAGQSPLRQINFDIMPPVASGLTIPGDDSDLMKPPIANDLFTPFTKDKYDMATLSKFGYSEPLYDPAGANLKAIVLKIMRKMR